MPAHEVSEILGDDFRLINAKELAAMLDISLRTIWRRRSDGSMPMPVRVGRSIRWRLLDIRNWIANGCTLQDKCESPNAVQHSRFASMRSHEQSLPSRLGN